MNFTSNYWKIYTETARQPSNFTGRVGKFPSGKCQASDTISNKLFTEWLEEIFKKLEWDDIGFTIDGEDLNSLRYADDIVLLSNSGEDLEKMISDLHKESLKVGFKMNMRKTKMMYISHLVGWTASNN